MAAIHQPEDVFPVAVREVEAWLLADRKHLAHFLHVPITQIPLAPEELENPKQTLVNLARKSRVRSIQKDMVPRPEVAARSALPTPRVSSNLWKTGKRMAPRHCRRVFRQPAPLPGMLVQLRGTMPAGIHWQNMIYYQVDSRVPAQTFSPLQISAKVIRSLSRESSSPHLPMGSTDRVMN